MNDTHAVVHGHRPEGAERVHVERFGDAARPTFLEKWGVVFVAFGGGWILLVSSVLFAYFLWKQPLLPPPVAGASAAQVKDQVDIHKLMSGEWRDSLSFAFDLLVTRTVLPIVTLLLGYLFGKTK